MNKQFLGVIFDFDGTLADTFPGIYSAWKQTFDALGLGPLAPEVVRSAIGPTREVYLKLILGERFDAHGMEALNLFKEIYKNETIFSTTLYPGISELLDLLDNAGVRMGIASNKPHQQILKLIEHFGIADCFCPVMGPDKGKEGKPAPDMLEECVREWVLPKEKILMVGDSKLDLLAGRSAGLSRAAVLWGYSSEALLTEESPDYLASTPVALADIVLKKRVVLSGERI